MVPEMLSEIIKLKSGIGLDLKYNKINVWEPMLMEGTEYIIK